MGALPEILLVIQAVFRKISYQKYHLNYRNQIIG